jgi:D-3-phosphoglycerate dehydrogenase
MGRNLSGKTIGLIGMGKVGQAFAHLLSGFGCYLLAYDPYYRGSWPAGIQRVINLNEMWAKADGISLHIPATEETRHILNRQVFQAVKHDVIFINTSRGDLIDESALFEFLQGHPEAGAYLDVFQQEPYTGPLTSLANIVVTPHIGTFTRETRVNMEIESVMNLINFFRNHE